MNIYAILGIIAALVGSHWWMYSQGKDSCVQESKQAALEYREKEIQHLKEIEEAKQKREVIYRDRIHIVKGASDPSGCLDTVVPDAVRMQLSGGGKAKP